MSRKYPNDNMLKISQSVEWAVIIILNDGKLTTDGRDEMEFNAARDQTLAAQALFLLQERGYSAEAADQGSEARIGTCLRSPPTLHA